MFYKIQDRFINMSLFSEECKAGKHGKACSESCGACLHSTVCNHITGNCELGCKPGWQNTETCKTGNYNKIIIVWNKIKVHNLVLHRHTYSEW